MRFDIIKKNHFSVTGWTIKKNLKNLTQQSALTELEEVKSQFTKLTNISNELADFIRAKKIGYNLDYDDSGKVSIGICSEEDGKITWKIDLPQ